MSKRDQTTNTGVLLDMWRPPKDIGDPIGCLATTYTFHPGLFGEQCLARFLDIDSEPNRDGLAFLLEREARLGAVYAGVLVDHTQAGVEHSYLWDVLPVRIRGGKQHGKVSLLAWDSCIRIIVASANLTDPGYRTNYEVANTVDLSPDGADLELLGETIDFLRSLLRLVPGASHQPPTVRRAQAFLTDVTKRTKRWTASRRRSSVRQHLVCSMPANGVQSPSRSSLDETFERCRGRGGSPNDAWIASPFFDGESETENVATALCKAMARGGRRRLSLCVPVQREEASHRSRIAAPKSLLTTPQRHGAEVYVEALPLQDTDKNLRAWHAKMVALRVPRAYSALMIGSSNFTGAGMGIGPRRNAEANLLTIVQHESFAREKGQLEEVWPKMDRVPDPEGVEWRGAEPELEEEEQAPSQGNALGFLTATYRAGEQRQIVIRLDPPQLPKVWSVRAVGHDESEILASAGWVLMGRKSLIDIAWTPVLPPEKLVVQWGDEKAFLPLNVENRRELPVPSELEKMTADDMLEILGATDPSAAFRIWAKRQHPGDSEDDELDSAVPIDLDPLRRYDLQATFLHRIRRRARVLAQLRANLQRPVSGRQALEWRLRGLIGVEALAERWVRGLATANGAADEALLSLADFLIVLSELDYKSTDGALSKKDFDAIFRSFLNELATKLDTEVQARRDVVSADPREFWGRVVDRCRV